MKSSFFKPYRMGFLKVTCTWNRICEGSQYWSRRESDGLALVIPSAEIMQESTDTYPCQWGTTTWVMDDVCHNSFDVPVPLCVVKRAMLSGSFSCSGMGDEHTPSSLTLGTNHTTHLQAMRKTQHCRLPVACTSVHQVPPCAQLPEISLSQDKF